MAIFRLHPTKYVFPDPSLAERDGLLAVGGDLAPERLLAAYAQGVFPWYGPGSPILWWSPDPRCVLVPGAFHCPRSLRRLIRKGTFRCTVNRDFAGVITACAALRENQGTWLVPEMIDAYIELHKLGYAHSVEAWRDHALVGGIYGVAMGGAFFGESMFFRESNASKVALAYLVDLVRDSGFLLLDCQQVSSHMRRFGAEILRRDAFLHLLARALERPRPTRAWSTPAP